MAYGRYHWRDGVYFKRSEIDEGTVDITVPFLNDPSKSQVISVPPAEWVSILAAVSRRGDTADAYADALALHVEQPPTKAPA